jgi:hypothetical protein
MIYLFDAPAFGFGVEPGTRFMALRAITLGLVFRGDTNPNADRFGRGLLMRERLHDDGKLNQSVYTAQEKSGA